MIANREESTYECVIIDLNTQRDFCEHEGARPVANRIGLMPALRRMIAWTKRNQVPMVSSVQAQRTWEVASNGHSTPCCIDGSPGQQKMAFTVLPCRVQIEVDNTLTISVDLFEDCQQVIFRKRTVDLMANPKADRFLTNVRASEFIIFGNCLESDVKAISLGLLARNKAVTVVRDACGFWDAASADLAVRQISAKGARVVSVDELLSRRLARPHRYRPSTNGNNGNSNENHHERPSDTGRNGRS